MGQAFPGTISRTAAVVAPGLMVMAVILFMGKVSGAHLNPAVSIAFALRRDFPWGRVPGYVIVQLAGAGLRRVVPAGRHPRLGDVRVELPGERLVERRRVLDGSRADVRARQRDPRHRVRSAERGRDRCAGRRRLHRARRALGKPDLRRVDEPRAHLRSRRSSASTSPLLGVRRRATRGSTRGGRRRVRPPWPRWRMVGSGAAQGALYTEADDADRSSAGAGCLEAAARQRPLAQHLPPSGSQRTDAVSRLSSCHGRRSNARRGCRRCCSTSTARSPVRRGGCTSTRCCGARLTSSPTTVREKLLGRRSRRHRARRGVAEPQALHRVAAGRTPELLCETDLHPGEYDEMVGKLRAGRRGARARALPRDRRRTRELRARCGAGGVLELGLGPQPKPSRRPASPDLFDVLVSSAWAGAGKPHPPDLPCARSTGSGRAPTTRCSSATPGDPTSSVPGRSA